MKKSLVLLFLGSLTFCGIASAHAAVNPTPDKGKVTQEVIEVNLNKADVDALTALSGIGPKRAQAIVDYRQQHGAFHSLNDLTQVRGINQHFVDKLLKNNNLKLSV